MIEFQESNEVGNEKERFARSNCKSGDEPLSRDKNESDEVGSELSEEFLVQVGVHQGSVLSPLLFAIAVDLISENARQGSIMKFCMRMT